MYKFQLKELKLYSYLNRLEDNLSLKNQLSID